MELFGRGYVIDHVLASLQHEAAEKRLYAYITDALKVMTENTAKFAGGAYISARWIESELPEKKEEKSGDEIAADIIQRIGLKLKGEQDG